MNILFIAPSFYGYERGIKKELEIRNHKVSYFNELPFKDSAANNLLLTLPYFVRNKILDIYNRKIQSCIRKEKIDTIFVIRGAGIQEGTLQLIKDQNVYLINYQWDSLRNNSNAALIAKYANKNYTFDIGDAKTYQYIYLPLFSLYTPISANSQKKKSKQIFFLGSYRPLRYDLANKFSLICSKQQLPFVCYLYISPLVYLRRKFLLCFNIQKQNVCFRPLGKLQYANYLKDSLIVLDIHSITQTGLTMRTMEALSMGCKLITTNSAILNTPFYSPNNILVWDGESDIDVSSFLLLPFDFAVNEQLLTVQTWLDKIGI